jgi:tuberculosinol/isotuberculosinol synthase
MAIIDKETFLNLPTGEVAKFVRAAGPQVCVFPVNGTRRWLMLEHGNNIEGDAAQAYFDIATKKHIELFQMCFDYGLDTLLTPIFGSEVLTRGDEYMQKIGAGGLAQPATNTDLLSFYEEYKVSVRFYGDYRKQLAGTAFTYLHDLYDDLTKNTLQNNRYRLFYGVFANDATETIAELSVQHFQKTGRIPSRRELVEQYYGEYIDPATLFIGFDRFSIFDYPLLGLGEEDLYFTVAPSLYLTENQLRHILYDHLFSRRVDEVDYATMPKEQFRFMDDFYRIHRQDTFGVGQLHHGIWYPLFQS